MAKPASSAEASPCRRAISPTTIALGEPAPSRNRRGWPARPCLYVGMVPEPLCPLPRPAPPSTLRVEAVTEATVEDWRHVHNVVIPTSPLTTEQVRERVGRYLLSVAYDGDVLVGCATVRPPDEDGNVTVIARVLPEHRRQGYGEKLFSEAMKVARGLGGSGFETVVLASNADGLRFALDHGFVEVSRYFLPGDEEPFIALRLA